ncbi:WD40 repeat-like protein [Exidia glandulosa HHB12029]|uniref:ASTRA-associated protein 1 n=1 Tax=Exidia glandulosa HHB12029 TaxID=1314781 RepID=A0A165F388_EXIGL|nr:WD40 repeat-like protein [Exidia glandulosa HHB12029]
MPAAPPPLHVLRNHSAQVSALSFSSDNERLYSGDTQGRVVMTSTRTLRPVAVWQAHSDSILGVEEWMGFVITHGRDNKLHLWARPEIVHPVGSGTAISAPVIPELRKSMDVNALNFCRFSLAVGQGEDALIALPNLVESSVADIWSLPAGDRLHAAIGKSAETEDPRDDSLPRGGTGIIMSLHLYQRSGLHLVTAFESGTVALWKNVTEGRPTVNGQGWQALWHAKLHVDSVMAMAVSPNLDFAITVSADHLIGRYDLDESSTDNPARAIQSKHAGNAALSIRSDGRVCAVAGWDGKIRLYSTKSFKSLGSLTYHREGCFCVSFSHPVDGGSAASEDPGEPLAMTGDELIQRSTWLAAGSKDSRVSIWQLFDLNGAGTSSTRG